MTSSEAGTASGQERRIVWIVCVVSTLASFNTSAPLASILPVLRNSFDTDVASISWVLTIYQLASAALVLTFGRVGDLYGQRFVLRAGLTLFSPAALACALAPNVPFMILARGIQGLGAAMLFSAGPALITRNCPPERRGAALGTQATVVTLAMTLGPIFSGLLTDHIGWQAVFLVSIPPALLAFVIVPRLLPKDTSSGARARFDVAGSVTIGLGLGGLLLALNQGPVWGWTSPFTLGVAALSLLVLVLFVMIERRTPDPMLDLSLFRRPTFVGSSVGAITFYVAISGVLVLVPLDMVEGRGYDVATAGLMLGAQQIARSIASSFGGRLSDRLGTKIPAVGGLLVMMLGVGLLSRMQADSSIVELALLLGVVGLGAGVYLTPNTSAIMGSVPRERQGLASAVVTTARNVGIATGVVMAGVTVTTATGGPPSLDVLYEGIRMGYLIMLAILAIGVVTTALAD